MLRIEYYDRQKRQIVKIEVPADVDVICVRIPADEDEDLPALAVNVNTDAVIIDRDGEVEGLKRLAMYTFQEVWEDAKQDV